LKTVIGLGIKKEEETYDKNKFIGKKIIRSK
jgi:hypothetical protein